MLLEISSMLLCGGATAALVSGTGDTDRAAARAVGDGGTAGPLAIAVELTDAARAALVEHDGAETEPEPEGFLLRLDGDDTLTLTLSEGVSGHVLVVEATVARPPVEGDGAAAPPCGPRVLALYILPEAAQVPAEFGTVAEADLIATLGLTRLGAVELGETVRRIGLDVSRPAVPDTARAVDRPDIVSNRPIVQTRAIFVQTAAR